MNLRKYFHLSYFHDTEGGREPTYSSTLLQLWPRYPCHLLIKSGNTFHHYRKPVKKINKLKKNTWKHNNSVLANLCCSLRAKQHGGKICEFGWDGGWGDEGNEGCKLCWNRWRWVNWVSTVKTDESNYKIVPIYGTKHNFGVFVFQPGITVVLQFLWKCRRLLIPPRKKKKIKHAWNNLTEEQCAATRWESELLQRFNTTECWSCPHCQKQINQPKTQSDFVPWHAL